MLASNKWVVANSYRVIFFIIKAAGFSLICFQRSALRVLKLEKKNQGKLLLQVRNAEHFLGNQHTIYTKLLEIAGDDVNVYRKAV